MKKILLYVAAVLMFGACSTPKTAYYFDHYRTTPKVAKAAETKAVVATTEQYVEPALLAAPTVAPDAQASLPALSRAEKEEIRQAVKAAVREAKRQQATTGKVAHSAAGMDHDLKLAAIFGAVGIVGLIIGGASGLFYIIGGIAFIIGVVFFVKWLIRQ